MTTFTEKMLQTTQNGSTPHKKKFHCGSKQEGEHFQDHIDSVVSGICPQKSSEFSPRNLSPVDYELLPIRSPRSNKSGATLLLDGRSTSFHDHKRDTKVQDPPGISTEITTNTGTSECADKCKIKDSEGKYHVLTEYPDSNTNGITTWCNHSGLTVCDPVSRMDFEKLEDKEVHMSQLEETNVVAAKNEELNLPGLQLDKIVTVKFPGTFPDLLKPSGSERHSYSFLIQHSQNKAKEDKSLDMHAGRKWVVSTSGKEKRNDTNLKETTLSKNSEWSLRDNISSSKYSTISASSLSNLSLRSEHSSGISLSCPRSTSIVYSSVPEKIPGDAQPYLVLENHSSGKKMTNDSFLISGLGINNFKGNHSTVVSSRNCENAGGDHSKIIETCNYVEESEDLQLQKKVKIETNTSSLINKALNFYYSSSIFAGRPEKVEDERLLLLHTIRKQVVLDEMQHLKDRATSKCGRNEYIEVSIKDISLHLRDDFKDVVITSKKQGTYYCLCIIFCQGIVFCTEAVKIEHPKISFMVNSINIKTEWVDNLQIHCQVYMLLLNKSKLKKTKGKQHWKASELCQNMLVKSKRYNLLSCWLTNSKERDNCSNGIFRMLQTRIRKFVLLGSVELNLPAEISKNDFILHQEKKYNKGDNFQPLHDKVHLNISCAFPSKNRNVIMSKTIFVQHCGFLTEFSVIKGRCAWQRGWWCIKGTYLMCWKYPDDEDKSHPISIIDLKLCAEKISPLSRLASSWRNTFSIKIKAKGLCFGEGEGMPHFFPSQVSATETVTEHILSADTRGERDDWCTNLNGILISLESWKIKNSII